MLKEKSIESLALAPVSVLPNYQNKGVGQSLIQKSLEVAEKLNFDSVIVMGHSEYYPKFEFKKLLTGVLKPLLKYQTNFNGY